MTVSLRPSIAGGRTQYSGAIYTGRQQSSQSRWTGNPSEARWRRQLLPTLTHNRYSVEAGLSTYAVYGRRSHEMKQTQTHVWSLAGEEAVSYSLARGKAAAVTRESGEVAAYSLARAVSCRKTEEPLLSRSSCLSRPSLDTMCGARALKIT